LTFDYREPSLAVGIAAFLDEPLVLRTIVLSEGLANFAERKAGFTLTVAVDSFSVGGGGPVSKCSSNVTRTMWEQLWSLCRKLINFKACTFAESKFVFSPNVNGRGHRIASIVVTVAASNLVLAYLMVSV